ncbi:MAG: hypothetical protein A2Y90_04025 [Chloroflexi bacterium RBG_13_52_12]|nr:MAG: hypothetical protein A2Y90_04025 [Chloroflexi bacterium RBG_13_52_12]
MVGTPALNGVYIAEMDMWPFETPEFNRISKFYDNLRENRFTSTKCKKCGYIAFPPGVICPKCWSEDLEWVDLPQRAKVVTITSAQAGAPMGFESPLIIAWLGFEKNAPLKHLLGRIIHCQEGEVKEGDEVKFVTFPVPAHPMEVKKDTKICDRVYYAWEPVK